MKCNVGKVDRVIRIILGIFIITLGVYFKSWFGLIGIIPILTAVVKFCPIYLIARISTCNK